MAELRWILLGVGLVFLAALMIWEKRRPRHGRRDAQLPQSQRSEPGLGAIDLGLIDEEAAPEPATSGARGVASHVAGAGRRRVMSPPRIDLPPLERGVDAPALAGADSLPVFDYGPRTLQADAAPARTESAGNRTGNRTGDQTGDQADNQPGAYAGQQPGEQLVHDEAPVPGLDRAEALAAPGEASLIIDWPPDGQRQIVALRIVSGPQERLSGRDVRLAISACGFVHGRFGIFHQPGLDGRSLLSVASLSKPGILDPANMDFQRLAGISLFAVLPGPLPPAAALDHLVATARGLSQRLQAQIQDEHGHTLDADRIENLRLNITGLDAEPAA